MAHGEHLKMTIIFKYKHKRTRTHARIHTTIAQKQSHFRFPNLADAYKWHELTVTTKKCVMLHAKKGRTVSALQATTVIAILQALARSLSHKMESHIECELRS